MGNDAHELAEDRAYRDGLKQGWECAMALIRRTRVSYETFPYQSCGVAAGGIDGDPFASGVCDMAAGHDSYHMDTEQGLCWPVKETVL